MSIFEGADEGELARLFQEFVREKMGSGPKPKFRDLWVKYEAFGTSPTDGGRTRIPSWYGCQRSHTKPLLAFFGDLPYDQCTIAKADEYRTWRRTLPHRRRSGGPVKAATVNRELRSAQGCLSYGLKHGLIPRTPMTNLQDERVIHDRDFSITQQDFLRIVQEARPLLRFFLILLYETGMRREEVRSLVWTEVNLVDGFIVLPWQRTKGAKERTVPLSSAARVVLEMIPNDGVNPYVFANPFGPKGPICRSTLSKWFIAARIAAGVTGPKGQQIWLHTLRHTWATDMATTGLNISTLMSIAGWADKRIADKYINIAQRHKEAAKAHLDERSIAITRTLQAGGGFGPKSASALKLVRAIEKKDAGK